MKNIVLLLLLLPLFFSCSTSDSPEPTEDNSKKSDLYGEYYLTVTKDGDAWQGTYEITNYGQCEDLFFELHEDGTYRNGKYTSNCEKDYWNEDLGYLNSWEYLGIIDGYRAIEVNVTGGVLKRYVIFQPDGLVKVKNMNDGPEFEVEWTSGMEGYYVKLESQVQPDELYSNSNVYDIMGNWLLHTVYNGYEEDDIFKVGSINVYYSLPLDKAFQFIDLYNIQNNDAEAYGVESWREFKFEAPRSLTITRHSDASYTNYTSEKSIFEMNGDSDNDGYDQIRMEYSYDILKLNNDEMHLYSRLLGRMLFFKKGN